MIERVARLMVVFAVLALLFRLLERAFADRRGQRFWREGFATDLGYWLFTPLITKSITRLAVAAALIVVLLLLGRPLDPEQLRAGFGPVGKWPAGA